MERELTKEEMARLVQQAINQGKDEAKFLLQLEIWSRQGASYTDYARYDVVYGDVIEVTLETFDEGYPYRKGSRIILIPKTVPTIVYYRMYSDTQSPEVREETVYVFTSEGWKSLRVS